MLERDRVLLGGLGATQLRKNGTNTAALRTARLTLTGVLVRARRDTDADELVGIARDVHGLDAYPPYLPNGALAVFLFGHETLGAWVAELDSRAVGHVALHPRTGREAMSLAAQSLAVPVERLGVVARLLVSPDHRRHGVARVLVEMAAADAVGRGLYPMLDVATRFHAATAVYERCGWVRA